MIKTRWVVPVLVVAGVATLLVRPAFARDRVAPTTIHAPPASSIRVLYSLDQKQNDRELIALIDAAKSRIDFAVYEFTLKDVADALVRAKQRGVSVRGLVDSTESAKPYDVPVVSELVAAGIAVETERHHDRRGIMHIKALVTDDAYAIGSYNWTRAATMENDEVLEIGTDPAVVGTYRRLLERVIDSYRDSLYAAPSGPAQPTPWGEYDVAQAASHVGEFAIVRGRVVDAHVSRGGTVTLEFCAVRRSCPFSAVVFARDAAAFGDLSRLAGERVKLTGRISKYRGRAEIKLTEPSQLAGE